MLNFLRYNVLYRLLIPSVVGTPTNVTANRTGYDSAKVSWTAPSTGPQPAGYEVFYYENENATSVRNTSSTELTLTGLTLGTYYIFVVGYGAEGDPVLPSFSSQKITIMIGNNYNIILCLYLTEVHDSSCLPVGIPQLQSAPILILDINTIEVSWLPTQFAPNSYRISYFCQLLCELSVTNQTVTSTVDGTSTTQTIMVNLGSSCVVNVTAVFGISINSNIVTSSINTISAGMGYLIVYNSPVL